MTAATELDAGQYVLDERYYNLGQEETAFFKAQTGIHNDDDLKTHILSIQEKAWKIHPYPCIRRFAFTSLKISRLPAYEQVLRLGRDHQDAILLDIGCCFGNDIRKAVADGFPVSRALASDLHPEFWALGHDLFKSTPESFPAKFIAGDAFNDAHLQIVPPSYEEMKGPFPPLTAITSLNALHGRVSAIHASSLFHLFGEDMQLHLARGLAGLLSSEPGSMIFGSHGGRPEKGYRTLVLNSSNTYMFCHNPESWSALWDGEIFKKGTVRVDAELQEVERVDLTRSSDAKFHLLVWSVTRL